MLAKIGDVNATEEFVAFSTKGTARKIHHGHKSVFPAIRPEFEALMFKVREQGIQLTNRIVRQEAAYLLPVFKHRTVRAKVVVVHCSPGLWA